MGESIWADLDAWQVQVIEDHLSIAVTLPVAMVKAVILNDVRDWDDPKLWSFPAVVVQGRDVRRDVGGMDGDGLHFDKLYPYFWLAITHGDQVQAVADAKLLAKRLEFLARKLSVGELSAGADGEIVNALDVGDTRLYSYRKPSAQTDEWYVVAAMAVTFDANI